MSATLPSHESEAIAVAAERRWTWIVGAIIAVLILMMVVTGVPLLPQATRM